MVEQKQINKSSLEIQSSKIFVNWMTQYAIQIWLPF